VILAVLVTGVVACGLAAACFVVVRAAEGGAMLTSLQDGARTATT